MAGFVSLEQGVADLLGTGRDGFGDNTEPTLPTKVPATVLNMPYAEVNNAIETLGGVLDPDNLFQLGDTIKSHLDNRAQRARWGSWRYYSTPAASSFASTNKGDIVAALDGLIVVFTGSAAWRIDRNGTATDVDAANYTWQYRAGPWWSDKIHTGSYSGGQKYGYYSGGETGTAAVGGSVVYRTVIEDTPTRFIRKKHSASNIETTTANTWSDLGAAYPSIGTYCAIFATNGRITLVGTTGVAYTDDAGATWTDFAHGLSVDSPSALPAENAHATYRNGANSVLIFADEDGANYHVSDDNGLTWTTYSPPGTMAIFDIKVCADEIAMVGSIGGAAACYVSTNGVDWSPRYIPKETVRIAFEKIGPTGMALTRIYALTTKGVFITTAA